MKKRKLGIIGGSGLYKMKGYEKGRRKKNRTPWGKPSDEILIAKFDKEEVCFLPRHARGHKISPTLMTSQFGPRCKHIDSFIHSFIHHHSLLTIIWSI